MKGYLVASGVAIALGALLMFRQSTPVEADESAQVARGEYLVKHVAMCVQCHSPRDRSGRLLPDKYFQGAPIPVDQPDFPNQEWAFQAPNIAGLDGYTDALAIRLLTEGVTRWGTRPRPPMPPFRMSEEDAAAVVAYLKTL